MPKTLIIPGKNDVGRYKSDMQTLETWARQPIQQLVAGSGITLSPATGLATDSKGNGPNPITISASGGGGTTFGEIEVGSIPNQTSFNNGFAALFGAVDLTGNDLSVGQGGQSVHMPSNSKPFTDDFYTMGGGWIVKTFGGGAVNQCVVQFPFWTAPSSSNPLTGLFTIQAMNISGSQQSTFQTNPVTLTVGGPNQEPIGDFFNFSQIGVVLTLGTDANGFMGLMTNTTDVWIGAWSCVIDVPPSTTF